jgi:hypothetical protein
MMSRIKKERWETAKQRTKEVTNRRTRTKARNNKWKGRDLTARETEYEVKN